MKYYLTAIISIFLAGLLAEGCKNTENKDTNITPVYPAVLAKPAIPFRPEHYICYRGDSIQIDGLLDEKSWQNVPWTSNFLDIEGTLKPEPLYNTRVKMLWDENYLYFAAELSEPNIWAYLKQRDTVVFYDNDFEIFIDPDGDTHGYYEFEMNAAGTIWDLLITMPYRDFGQVLNAWDIKGMKSSVRIYGTLNDPRDTDDRWVIELAMPFSILTEWGKKPADSLQWRINFSRVNWQTMVENGKYIKKRDPETGRVLPEYNWVWSPQGLVNMHYPEMWGYLQFSEIKAGEGEARFIADPDSNLKWQLRTLYYAQRAFAARNGYYSDDAEVLGSMGLEAPEDFAPEIIITHSGYEASARSIATGRIWIINNWGRIYYK